MRLIDPRDLGVRTVRLARRPHALVSVVLGLAAVAAGALPGPGRACAAWVWVEGEKPVQSTMHRFPGWYDRVKRDQLSGGDFISNWHDREAGEASYRVAIAEDGEYAFWVRFNPIQSRLSYKINEGEWTRINQESGLVDTTNVADDGKPDLRALAWLRVGRVPLRKGTTTVQFRMESENNHHGYLDCFLFTNEPFTPAGPRRPDQAAAAVREAATPGWFVFAPGEDRFSPGNGIDLRPLNEAVAGENGPIAAKGNQFVQGKTGRPIRFWAVNGPVGKDRDALRDEARILAKRGVNLVRFHGAYFDEKGAVKMANVLHAIEVVEAMKAEGIYTHFSIYFPVWFSPPPGTPWLLGYDGKTHPFAALFFNKDFQEQYRSWWKALLLTPSPSTGKRLIDDPAVAGLEIQNEDSYFFWTFGGNNVPEPQLRMLETQFGGWLKQRYGSIDAALKRWGGTDHPRDRPAEGRIGFRHLWNMAHEKTLRDQDTARFLAGSQRTFYRESYAFLRSLGFKGVITASNWVTADAQVFGPIERYTYSDGDFIDRHGYFSCHNQGEGSEWSIRDGHTYIDRSALRFDPEEPGKPKLFSHPIIDIGVDDKPSMISETTFVRPNRYRSEAPLFFATYGALQGTDAIVHFAIDSSAWSVKPGFFVGPWTLMTPAMIGQFPAAALIFRKGLVAEGDLLCQVNLRPDDLFDLKGTPLPQDASFDELRLKDVPKGLTIEPGQVIDPLIHFAGRTGMTFSDQARPARLKDLKPYVDRARQTVVSTNGQLRLDFGKGVLTINSPAAQGLSGALRLAGTVDLADLTITSNMELGHIVAVSLDDAPLARSSKILLQVMSEEKSTGFKSEPAAGGSKKIVSIGRDPWQVRDFEGLVRLKRPDAGSLTVTALDANGERLKSVAGAGEVRLGRTILYYLIETAR